MTPRTPRELAYAILQACTDVPGLATVELDDGSYNTFEEDGSGVWPSIVGTFHCYGIVERVLRALLGIPWLRYRSRVPLVDLCVEEGFPKRGPKNG